MMENDAVYAKLLSALREQAVGQGLMDEPVPIHCHPLTAADALGSPDDLDYPILKGKEAIVEATFREAKGHAFSDEYGNSAHVLRNLLERFPQTNRERAEFVATLNAVYRHLGLCDRTIHCRDNEPRDCAKELATRIGEGMQVLLVGYQPRMLEWLAKGNPMRVLDLDPDNIGTTQSGVVIEGPEKTEEAIDWCHVILATGSSLVNGTLPCFLHTGKPAIFYGVTIAAAAKILHLDRYCFCAH
jgi:hypothetical protein